MRPEAVVKIIWLVARLGLDEEPYPSSFRVIRGMSVPKNACPTSMPEAPQSSAAGGFFTTVILMDDGYCLE